MSMKTPANESFWLTYDLCCPPEVEQVHLNGEQMDKVVDMLDEFENEDMENIIDRSWYGSEPDFTFDSWVAALQRSIDEWRSSQ